MASSSEGNTSVDPSSVDTERRRGYLHLDDFPEAVVAVSNLIADHFATNGLWPTQARVWREMHERQVKAREVVQDGAQVFSNLSDSPQGDRFVQLRPWALYDTGKCRDLFEEAYTIYLDVLKDLAVNDQVTRTRQDVSRHLGVGASAREVHQVLWVLHCKFGGAWSEKEIDSEWKADFFVGILEHPTPDLEALFLSRPMGTRPARTAPTNLSTTGGTIPRSTIFSELAGVRSDASVAGDKERDAGIRDRFRNLTKLGEGAYANVWQAEDTKLRRTVALKLVRASAPSSHDALAHARALARVEHDNVVKVYEVTDVFDPTTDEVTSAVVMEFVKGPRLSERLKLEGFTLEEAKWIGQGLLSAVVAYHGKGLAHTDLHDENVILGTVHLKVLDPLFFETSTVRSTAALDSVQARDRRAARDLLVCVLRHTATCSLDASAAFERTTVGADLSLLHAAFVTATAGPVESLGAKERRLSPVAAGEAQGASRAAAAAEPSIANATIEAVRLARPDQGPLASRLMNSLAEELKKLDPHALQGEPDVNLVEAIAASRVLVDQFGRVVEAIADMNAEQGATNLTKGFEAVLRLYDRSTGGGATRATDSDFFKFLGHEMCSVLFAHLMRASRWDLVGALAAQRLYVDDPSRGAGHLGLRVLSSHLKLLDIRAERTKTRQGKRISIHADLLKERHEGTHPVGGVNWDDFRAADLLLALALDWTAPSGFQFHWFPRSSIYLNGSTPRFLVDALTLPGARELGKVFRETDIATVRARVKGGMQRIGEVISQMSINVHFGYHFDPDDIGSIR